MFSCLGVTARGEGSLLTRGLLGVWEGGHRREREI